MFRPRGFKLQFRHYLVSGLFLTVPVVLTFVTMLASVRMIDNLTAPLLETLLGRRIPGLGLVATFLWVLGAGWLATNVIGKTVLEFIERLLLKIPGFAWLYKMIKQIVEAFSPDKQGAFRRVVLVEYPRAGAWSLGFVTKELVVADKDAEGAMVAVYIPTNHFYLGDYVLFPKSEVRATPLTVQEGIQCALSAGAAIPDRLDARTPDA